jgi:enoyl-CoA hydratase
VLLATLDNPPFALMDDAIVDALDALARRAEEDPDVTGVVFTGTHPERFIAHYDVGELLEIALASPPVSRPVARASHSAVAALRRVPGGPSALDRSPLAGVSAAERFGEITLRFNRAGAVVIAAINGSAAGGGCELALACDRRIMAEGPFRIGQPEILLGFPPGGGGTQRLTRMLGTAAALQLCLDGGPIEQDEALRIGLIDEIVPAEGMLEHALAVAKRLASRPKAGIAAVKRSIYLGGSESLPVGLRIERSELAVALVTDAAKAAMKAYVDATEERGDLPGYDEGRLERALEDGRFT